MTNTIKSMTLFFSSYSKFCNKDKYFMFEHFKIHKETLILNSYQPSDNMEFE